MCHDQKIAYVLFVSWDDDIPNIWKVIKFMFQTTNQVLFILLIANGNPILLRSSPRMEDVRALRCIPHECCSEQAR